MMAVEAELGVEAVAVVNLASSRPCSSALAVLDVVAELGLDAVGSSAPGGVPS